MTSLEYFKYLWSQCFEHGKLGTIKEIYSSKSQNECLIEERIDSKYFKNPSSSYGMVSCCSKP